MKLKRKGGLTAGIITLSAVALTSVGFAAWVISAGDTAEITGNIEVDTVTDDSHSIYAIYDGTILDGDDGVGAALVKNGQGKYPSAQNIRFGAPVTKSNSSGKWLSYNPGTEGPEIYESLTATYFVCVRDGAATLSVNDHIKVGFQVVDSSSATSAVGGLPTITGFTGLVNANMVQRQTVAVTKLTGETSPTAAVVETKTSVTESTAYDANRTWFKVDVEFKWGSLWAIDGLTDYSASATYALGALVKYAGHTYKCTAAIELAEDWNPAHWEDLGTTGNPYSYYNSMLSNATIADDANLGSVSASVHANKYLTALNEVLHNAGYSMTFKTYANRAEKQAATDFVTDTSTNLVVAE